MSLKLLFRQLSDIREEVKIPLLLMGYLNPVLQFGIANFCAECKSIGIDGVILPDLPPQIFVEEYLSIFDRYNLYNILLISPHSSADRISAIDKVSRGFVYMVSSSSVTGTKNDFSEEQITYFKRVQKMNLENPCLIGFGISNRETFKNAGQYARGAIIGSAFVKTLGNNDNVIESINQFIRNIKS
jgi:tryptophan synthase alpha chain